MGDRAGRRALLGIIAAFIALGGGAAEGAPPVAQEAAAPTVELRIGKLTGPPAATFGLVEDVQPLESGGFVVLDSRTPALKLYGEAGELLDTMGEEGEGPGEFLGPEAVASDRDRIYVSDTGNSRIHVYTVDGGALVLRGGFRTPFFPYDLCILHGRLYVIALHDGHTIHELSAEGDIVRSFGEPADASEAPEGWARNALRQARSIGFLGCSESTRTVVSLGLNVPDVRAFTPEGEPRWSTTLRDYGRMGAEMTPEGRMVYTSPPAFGGHHQAVGLVVRGELVLAQVVLTTRERSVDEAPVETRVLEIDRGVVRGEIPDLPRLAFAREDRYYGYRHVPYPEVVILRVPR